MARQIFYDHENKLNYVESMLISSQKGGEKKKDEKQMRKSNF